MNCQLPLRLNARFFAVCGISVSLFLPGCGGGSGGPAGNNPIATERVAFISNRSGGLQLYLMNGDGTGQIRLTQNAGLERSPSWSPDGKRLIFSYSPDRNPQNAEIYLVDADGSNLQRVTTNNFSDDEPRFNFDGTKIVWESSRSVLISDIIIADASGENRRNLTQGREGAASSPCFDRQNRVIFVSTAFPPPTDSSSRLVRVEANGANRTQISQGAGEFFSPIISSVGQMAFVKIVGGDFQIFSTPDASWTPMQVTNTPLGNFDPAWSADGRSLFFASLRDGNVEIYRANGDGSNPRRLTTDGQTDRLPAAF